MIVKDFVIIGGGIAGLSAIKAIREETSTATILWISDEDRIPYKRTQINKHIAEGFQKDDFALIQHEWLVDNHIELLYDRVEHIDIDKHELSFLHRGHLKYKKLIIATGNKPKTLDVIGLPDENIYHVNTARQVENIIRSSAKAKKYLVFGAGVEGVETAWQLIKMGKEVVIIDRCPVVLERFFTPKFSNYLKEAIGQSGAELILNAENIEFIETESGAKYAKIEGQEYPYHAIISSIGYTPNFKLADEALVKCNRGILVNEFLETSALDIYAAGDVAEHPSGAITCLWHAAEHQGTVAGKNAYGNKVALELKPFRMRTDVFDEFYFSALPKKQDFELVTEEKENIVRDLYFNDGKLVGVLMKNDKDRAKIYQRALMEKWNMTQVQKELPL